MSIQIDGTSIHAALPAPEGGATLRLRDGERTVWEGRIDDSLRLELDGAAWGIPEPIRDLLSISLPSTDNYSPAEFVPLATDFMSLATYRVDHASRRGHWVGPAPVSGQLLPLNIMAGALHYAQSVFEGSKVYFTRLADGRIQARMFRPERNAARMWRSALHMGIPLETGERDGKYLDLAGFTDLYLQMTQQAVEANLATLFAGRFGPLDISSPDFRWDETPPSVYLRPVLFASGPVLGVKPADHYTFGIYVTPVGKYRADLVLRIETEHPRAFKGGTGAAKAACNYAPTLNMMRTLKANKAVPPAGATWTDIYDDIPLLAPQGYIEEMGGANFFVLAREGDRVSLRSPPSLAEDPAADTILPGVTRDTVLQLGRLLGFDVRVEPIALTELLELSESDARDTAVFTTGTAAGIAPVVALLGKGGRGWRFASWDDVDDPIRRRKLSADDAAPGSALEAGRLLRTCLFRTQLGDHAGLLESAGDRGQAIIDHAAAEGWVESFELDV